MDRMAWLPGLATLLDYRRSWLANDLVAGLVLTAILVPVGMGYAEASGLPAINGLYATILPLVAYAVFGPSRIMVLGPDSTMAAVIAALIVPLSAGDPAHAVALAGALALLSGACSLLIGFARLGLVADLLSKPIRIGFLNAIALTVLTGQLPKVFGFSVKGDALPDKAVGLIEGIAAGHTHRVALAIGAGSLAFILLLKRHRPRWPGILLALALATLVSGLFDLSGRTGLPVLGALPQGLPEFRLPMVSTAEILRLLPGALIISLLSFADTSVLSRALAQRGGYAVSQNQEMIALGAANIASGLFQGFSISSSASRTPVAEAAGARTQLTGLIGALAIALLLVLAPTLLQSLPSAVLGAVVIAACLSFADLRGMAELYRRRRDRGHLHRHRAGAAGAGLEHLASAFGHPGAGGRCQGLPRHQPPSGRSTGARPGAVPMGRAPVFRQRRAVSRTDPWCRLGGAHPDAVGGGGRRRHHRCRHHGCRRPGQAARGAGRTRHHTAFRRAEGPGEGPPAPLRHARSHRPGHLQPDRGQRSAPVSIPPQRRLEGLGRGLRSVAPRRAPPARTSDASAG